DVRPEVVVLAHIAGVRPGGTGDQGDPPGRLLEDAGGGSADVESAPGLGRRRVEQLLGPAVSPAGQMHVAERVYIERDYRVGQAALVPIEIADEAGESVGQLDVQRLVGVGH